MWLFGAACTQSIRRVKFFTQKVIEFPKFPHSECITMLPSAVPKSSSGQVESFLAAYIIITLLVLLLPCQSFGEEDPRVLPLLFERADAGDAFAQYELGMRYEQGRGVEADSLEAFSWYSQAAEQDFALAQYKLGDLYCQGKGIGQDYAEAEKWYRKAATQGIAEAQYNLGVMYYRGAGVAKNYREAFNWLEKAAENGVVEAQYQLSIMYANGEGVSADFDKAVSWLRKSATQGYAKSERLLQKLGLSIKK